MRRRVRSSGGLRRVTLHQPQPRCARTQRAQRPARAAGDLPEHRRGQLRRNGQPRPALALAPRGAGHIDGQHQRAEARRARPRQQVAPDARILRRVELEPPHPARQRPDLLGQAGGNGGEAAGNARRGGAARQNRLGPGPDEPRHAHRRDAERRGEVLPQKRRGQIGRHRPAQHRGHQPHGVERGAVGVLHRLAAGGAVEIFPDESRHPAAAGGAQISKRGVALVEVHGGVISRAPGTLHRLCARIRIAPGTVRPHAGGNRKGGPS